MKVLFKKALDMVGNRVVYAIAFDLDIATLQTSYRNASYTNAYKEIEAVLSGHGFSHPQGSLYFGDPARINAVTCVMAIMDLTTRCSPWFALSVRDIRMLRIEDNNDLMPAVQRATP